ncbi:MAG: shikimate kinase, partial [Novibacillus thermophilus]
MKLHIILIGFMGTGKTTVGTIIAETLSRQMVDTDQYLEEKRGKTIPDIFRDEGEARFRDCEHNVLKELIQSPKPLVITTGGG